jgi:hypothetical protein
MTGGDDSRLQIDAELGYTVDRSILQKIETGKRLTYIGMIIAYVGIALTIFLEFYTVKVVVNGAGNHYHSVSYVALMNLDPEIYIPIVISLVGAGMVVLNSGTRRVRKAVVEFAGRGLRDMSRNEYGKYYAKLREYRKAMKKG